MTSKFFLNLMKKFVLFASNCTNFPTASFTSDTPSDTASYAAAAASFIASLFSFFLLLRDFSFSMERTSKEWTLISSLSEEYRCCCWWWWCFPFFCFGDVFLYRRKKKGKNSSQIKKRKTKRRPFFLSALSFCQLSKRDGRQTKCVFSSATSRIILQRRFGGGVLFLMRL